MSDASYDDDVSSDSSSQLTSPFNYSSPTPSERLPSAGNRRDSVVPSNNNINVICRFRPSLDQEQSRGGKVIVDTPTSTSCALQGRDTTANFTFDRVFGVDSAQHEVYQFSITQTVDDLMNGYNGTVLAYGQTGSGKSYTMMGSSLYDEDERGIIPRIAEDIFNHIGHGSSDIEYTVGVSYFEIYMEQIRDLLDDSNGPARTSQLRRQPSTASVSGVPGGDLVNTTPTKYHIHQDKTNGIYVKGLKQAFVASSEEMLTVLQKGLKNRTQGQTLMNSESSRSHAIFQIKLTQKHVATDITKRSQLFLVDLAGSEKVDKTGAVGQTLEEAKKINSSLSALGNVINSLTDGKSSHIPYRDSKLTRILQESLGGNSRTSLIINCSPSSLNEQETLSTLRFGTRAKNIKNSAHVNTEVSAANLKQRLAQMEKLNQQNQIYIRQLESELMSWRSGGQPPPSVPPSARSSVTLPNNHLHLSHHSSSVPGSSLSMIYSPSREFQSRLPGPSGRLSQIGSARDEIDRRDKKISELEEMLLSYRMDRLRNSHSEDSKLFGLESTLAQLNDKLTEMELVNVNLRKHLLISEKIIESRDIKINKLKSSLKDQQLMISRETLGFKSKLGDISSKLEYLNKQKEEEISIMKRNSAASSAAVSTMSSAHSDPSSREYPDIEKVPTHTTVEMSRSVRSSKSTTGASLASSRINTTSVTSFATTKKITDDVAPATQSPKLNFTQEYVSIGEFLAESRRRSKLLTPTIPPAGGEHDSSDTSGMFDEPTSPSSKSGLNLRIIKPFRGGSAANSVRSSKVESLS
ncbi:hypothetical protein DIURU_005792 [Diutina rugosa]|uniref:Kinesin-like protein n=1 Tax=Diutina rugosa TaxID=5481 RepID=A0A642UBW9_DIURU|nr:uncharacterized protein DIURU_005792 [Diutina rugosa]KAA8896420.1 hypothetical protein DIURU_005792 [Diutina rugosa]